MKVKIRGVDRMNNELINTNDPKGSFKDVISLVVLASIFIVIIIVVSIFLKPIILENLNQEALEFLNAFDEDVEKAEIIEGDTIKGNNIEGVTKIYKALDTGTIVTDLTIKGYGGDIRALVGIDGYGAVIGTVIISEKETPGIGTVVFDNDYMLQYVGLTIDDFSNYSYEDLQTYPVSIVAGSTISSKALSNIIYITLQVSETVK